MALFEFGGSKSKQSATQRVDVPPWLLPFVQQSGRTASGSLSNLSNLTQGPLVAGFSPEQQAAQDLAMQRAGGAGGFIPTAQNAFMQGATGGLDSFIPQSALNALTQGAQGQSFLPQQSRDALTQLGLGGGQLQGTDTLQQTANGDFLHGGQGFDQAVQAAVRSALPGVRSVFGSAGPGASSGGLAQAAIGQSAVDAFARQFGQERQNQLGAARQLAGFDLAGGNQQISALNQLAGIGQGEQAIQQGAAGTLAGFGDMNANRNLFAAGMLPDIAMADVNLMDQVGAQKQNLAQQQIDAPMMAQLNLLSAAMGGLPIESLLGQTAKGKSSNLNFKFGFES